MLQQFDLVVIGSGTAGQIPAYQCRKAGWSVAMIESRLPGGTCANSGCDAKKPLADAAALIGWSRRMASHGITGHLRADWPTLMAFKRSFTDPIPDNTRQDLREAGIVLFEGIGRFIDPQTVRVGSTILRARRIVIATGLVPRPLRFPGEELIAPSDKFLELNELPGQIVFIGGGYISFEFASIAARCGAEVTIIEERQRVLQDFDSATVAALVEASRREGLRIEVDSCVDGAHQEEEKTCAECSRRQTHFSADLLVHGAGRIPAVADLDLGEAGISYDDSGIIVDDTLRSVSNPQVYAAGDVSASGGPPLTPVSALEGVVVAHNLLHEDRPRNPDYLGVPRVVYTDPPLAAVGLSPEEAAHYGLKTRLIEGDMRGWKVSQQSGSAPGYFRVLIDQRQNRICGAHLYCVRADEIINLFALAVRLSLSPEAFRRTLYASPTLGNKLSSLIR